MNSRKRNIVITLFLIPAVTLFAVFFAYPLITVFITSFCDWTLGQDATFVGLKNYITLFCEDADFKDALKNTLVWTVLTVAVQVPLSLLVALVLSKKPRGWKFVRNCFIVPNIISTVAIGAIFTNMLDGEYGIVNAVIRLFNPDFYVSWLQDTRTAFWAVTLSWIFYGGANVLLILAEISAIPSSVIEAARIDGATESQIDRRIIIPYLRNVMGTVTVIVSSFAITEFSEVYILTKGGPLTKTLNLGVYLHRTAMLENHYSLANAVGMVQLVLGAVTILLINKAFRMGKSIGE